MICLDGADDWIFVTEKTENCWDIRPLLFEDVETALEYSEPWVVPGKEENVKVVKYEN
jgi:hypothetical protein